MKSIIEFAGGYFPASGTNTNDFISEGLGGNTGNYAPRGPILTDNALNASVSSWYIPVIGDLAPMTIFTNILDIPKLGGNKYPIYEYQSEENGEIITNYTYIKPTPDAEPVNKISPHGSYVCLAGLKCAEAFGDPVPSGFLYDDLNDKTGKHDIKLIKKHIGDR